MVLKDIRDPAWSRRRRWLGMLVPIIVCVLALGACSSNGNGDSASNGGSASGGTATYAIGGSDLANLNTQMTSNSGPLLMADAWADGLFAWDGDGNPVPHLAKSWDISKDGLTYTFHLRSGVKWSDGQPFSSDDVVFTMTQVSKYNTYLTSVLPHIASVTAPDPQTVVIQLKNPFTPLLSVLNKETFPILPKHVYETGDIATNPANTKPVGLGPFMLQSWESGKSLTFVRNPNYWDKPKPYLDKVVFAIIPSAVQAVNALQAGEVDMADLSYTNVANVQSNNKIRVFHPKVAAPERMTIDFNTTRSPLSDSAVRQALFMAINRKQIVDSAYHGLAQPAVSAIPPAFKDLYSAAVDYNKMYPFDPKKAESLLDQAGYPMKNGKRFSIDYTYITGLESSYPFEAVARIVAANWKDIGVDVNLDGLAPQLWIDKVYNKRDFDVSEISLTARTDPAFGVDRSFLCNSGHDQYVNPTGYCNPALDQIIQSARTAPTSQRMQYYKQYEEIVAKDLNELTLTNVPHYRGFSTKLSNLDKALAVSYDEDVNFAELKRGS